MAIENVYLLGIISGLLATIVMTIFMMIGKKTGMAPMDLTLEIGKMVLGKRADKRSKKVGMITHIFTGTIWGLIYALFVPWFGLGLVVGGMVFALIPWIIMQLITFPMMGVGLFGLKVGMKAPIMTLILHLIYGASLGYFVSVL